MNDPEYFNRPAFKALNLSPAQLRAARSLPRRYAQIFGQNLPLWIDLLAQRVAELAPALQPVECGQFYDWEARGARFERTDAGRKASGIKERRDCTVRALAGALDIPYDEAHAKLAALGRKKGCGFTFRENTVGHLGLELCPELCCRRLENVLPEIPAGRFVVRIKRHVFAVVHGAIHDVYEANPKSIVLAVYRVKGAI